MAKKYEFTGETKVWLGRTLHRIRALISFGEVEVGELGGWIEKEENLSHGGSAWVGDEATVYGEARVYGSAMVCGEAWVCGEARVWRSTHYLCISPMGSRFDFTTFFRAKDKKINVKCGCFRGDIDAFSAQVQATHGDNQHAKAYMAAIELARVQIDLSGEDPEVPESEANHET